MMKDGEAEPEFKEDCFYPSSIKILASQECLIQEQ